jgi:hypothetical protein
MNNQVHCFCFNEEDNGGEALTLITSPDFDNANSGNEVFYTQKLLLMSHCNSASFYLPSFYFNPVTLRKLADELESFMNQVEEPYLLKNKKRIEDLRDELKRLETYQP